MKKYCDPTHVSAFLQLFSFCHRCDSCYYFCGGRLLSCDVKDLWNLKCEDELVMGCTEADLDARSSVSSEVSKETANASSGALGSAAEVVILALAVVVALAA